MRLCGLWRNKAFLRGEGDVTLNLAQLLCVLQREENWSRERIARRAQPAGSPAGIQGVGPSRRLRAARGSQRQGAPSRASPKRGRCERGTKARGENGEGGEGQRAAEEASVRERRKT